MMKKAARPPGCAAFLLQGVRMKQILLLEDDPALGEGIRMALQGGETAVTLVRTVKDARAALEEKPFDLGLWDVNLPDGDGISLTREIRAAGNRMPVILLTVHDLEMEIVAGLEAGADDYITKPFSLAILRARVAAGLRRGAGTEKPGDGCYQEGPFVFDFGRMAYYKNGQPVELSRTEQRLLRILTENRGFTLSREKLIDWVWTEGAEYVDENALSVAVRRLRGKLEDDPAHPVHLKTVYGVGYSWS